MDTLKKILVLLTSLAMIGLVVYVIVVSSATQPVKTEAPTRDTVRIEVPIPTEPENPLTMEPDTSSVATVPGPSARASTDTIGWMRAPKVTPEVPPLRPEQRVFPYLNPNPFFTAAAKRILPAVVSIHSTRKVKAPRGDSFHWFLPRKDNEEDDSEDEEGQEFFHPGTGSGIIIGHNGYILTNYHVVEGAQELRVKLYDKREFEARYVGGDPTTDVALIKIDAHDLPVAYIGNSDSVQIGEWVMAVGNPLNFTSTVTAGIVSAIGRDISIIDVDYRIENFIQTDAVINPGNSGGALVNLKGEVIGINTAIATRTGLYQGYGFAIPINLAKKVADDLLRYGRVRRGFLGVSIENVSDANAKGVGLPRPIGALVQGVQKGFPAEKAGIRQGDIIIAVNGREVTSVNDLQLRIAQHSPGDRVRITIWRDGRAIDLDVVLGEAPINQAQAAVPPQNEPLKYERLGLTLREITEQDMAHFNVDRGVYIARVAPGSPADVGNIFPAEILLEINGEPVNSVADFDRILSRARPGEILKMLLRTRSTVNRDRIVYVQVPED
ncbi:MAG: Do family serine endopeptidase [Calditrichaeota bacterium]|nr:Do family serine endopeptidase [Calditrichota bacterium]